MADDKPVNTDTPPAAVETPAAAPATAPAATETATAPVETDPSEKGQKLAFIADLADEMGVVDPQIEDIKTTAKKIKEETRKNPPPAPATPVAPAVAPVTAPAATAPVDTPPVVDAPPATPAPDAAPAVDTPPASEEESTFFGGSKDKTPDFKTSEEVSAYVKDRYAIEIKGPEDYKTLFNSIDGWRTDAEEHSKVSKKYDDLLDGFQDLPPALAEAFQTWASAGDWEATLKEAAGRVDFTKDFGAHPREDMLKAYFSDATRKINANEDLDDDQKKTQLDGYYDSAGKLYANDKQTFDVQRAEAITNQETQQRRFKESALSSVQHLKSKYPDFSDSDLQSVQDRLVGGTVYNLLFEKDGTYKKDAAVRAAMLLFGEKEIEKSRGKAAAQAKSEANLEVVTRGGDKPTSRGGAQTQPNPKTAKDVVSMMAPLIDQSPYAHKGDGN